MISEEFSFIFTYVVIYYSQLRPFLTKLFATLLDFFFNVDYGIVVFHKTD